VARIGGNISDLKWSDINADRVDDMKWKPDLEGRRIWCIDDDALQLDPVENLKKLVTVIEEVKKQCPGEPPLVIIDFLQDFCRGDGDQKTRLTNGAIGLRRIAKKLDLPIVAVSSIGREGYGVAANAMRENPDPRIWLRFAKESGDIDYAASVVWFLDVLQEVGDDNKRVGRIAIAKCRGGQEGFAGVKFSGASGRFEPYEPGAEQVSQAGAAKVTNVPQLEVTKQKLVQYVSSPNYTPMGKTALCKAIGGRYDLNRQALGELLSEYTLELVDVKDEFKNIIKGQQRVMLKRDKVPESKAPVRIEDLIKD
jgi:hypothetical protein